MSDFEDGALWSFGNGPEFPGATGSATLDPDAHSGSAALRLTADLTNGGKYVSVGKASNLDLQSLTFWVKSETATRLTVRLIDSTGQNHQQFITLTPGQAWQEVAVTDPASGTNYIHFAGANDGVWHGPLKSIAINVDEGSFGGAKTGSILIDDVVVTAPPAPLALEQVAHGNIFVDGETAAIDIQSAADSVAWTLTGLDGSVVDNGALTMDDATERLEFPDLEVGYYTLSATAASGETVIGTASAALSLLVEHDEPEADSPFGMSTHLRRWETTKFDVVGLLDKAGSAHVRDDPDWGRVEPEAGTYAFTHYDEMAEALTAADIEWLPVAAYTNPHYDNNATPHSDAGREGFANYATALLEHYDTPSIEVYNEFNIGFGDRGDGPADSKAEYYFPLLKKTFEEIKAADPDTVVVGGATAGVPLAWLETLFQLGGLEYMDVLSIHPYLYPRNPDGLDSLIDQVNALVKEYNDGETIPLWITEQGWPTGTDARASSEQSQANYIVQTHVRALSKGVERLYWYDFMNDGTNPADTEENFGVIRAGSDALGKWTPKPAYVAYSTMTAQLQNADFVRSETIGTGTNSYVFAEGGTQTRVIWSDQPTTVALATNEPVTVIDQQGRETEMAPLGGVVEFAVSAAPVFVEGDVAGASTSRLALELPASVAAADEFTATLRIDNGEGEQSIEGEFSIAGQTVPVVVAAGSVGTFPVTLTATSALGTQAFTGTLTVDGRTVGSVNGTVTVISPVAIASRHALRDTGDVIEVTVTNASSSAFAPDEIVWSIGDRSGTTAVAEIAPSSSAVIDIPIADLPPGSYATSVAYEIPGMPAATSKTTTIVVDPATQRPIAHSEEASSSTVLDLTADGNNVVKEWSGEADLSGTIVPTWDEEALHLHAVIVDDVHAQPNSGEQIWAGDSIQFTVQAGMPGETSPWDELGIALTADGPNVFKWVAGSGAAGAVTGAEAQVVRDDAAGTTTYDLALPWSVIAPADASTRLISLSFAINDDDGAGRTGWIEVGKGIATAKDNKLFLPFTLQPGPVQPTCDTTISDDRAGALVINEGTTCISDVTISGPVLVKQGAVVRMEGTLLKGVLISEDAASLEIVGAELRGALSIRGTMGHVLINESVLKGAALISGNSGGVTVSGNTVKGVLRCTSNDPAPSNAGSSNTVKGLALSQCAGL